MSMQINVDVLGNKATIVLNGRFDFSTHSEFSNCYSSAIVNGNVSEVDVELGNVEYLDSAALGMLLLLSERAKIANKSVALVNPNEMVAQVLERVKFGRIFAIR
jgi:HptB-dependent secretion and biofilm anti anti-sigma factor